MTDLSLSPISYDPDPEVRCPWCGETHSKWADAYGCFFAARDALYRSREASGNFDPYDKLSGPYDVAYGLWDAVTDYLNYPTRYKIELFRGHYKIAEPAFYQHPKPVEQPKPAAVASSTPVSALKFIRTAFADDKGVASVTSASRYKPGAAYVSSLSDPDRYDEKFLAFFQTHVVNMLKEAGLSQFRTEIAQAKANREFYAYVTVIPDPKFTMEVPHEAAA